MTRAAQAGEHARLVGDVLRGYAERGVFRSFSGGETRGGRTTFGMVWHHGREFRLVLDAVRGRVSFPALLPGVPPRSPMLKDLKAFLHEFETDAVPEHRRLDQTRVRLDVRALAGGVSLALDVPSGDYEYAVRRLVHLAHEVFMVFLPDGPYLEYRIEQLGLDPDTTWA